MSIISTPKLLVAGATGLVGSKFVDTIRHKFAVQTIGRENVDLKIDLTSEKEVVQSINFSDAKIIVNFAAYTNVDGAESEKGKKSGEVYTLNALLPLWLARICKKTGKSLYHISTDYVFNGKKDMSPYTEEDLPQPVNSWYAISKLDGETNVQEGFEGKGQFAILRISYPYSATYNRKLDFARVIIDKLLKGENYFGIKDQKIKPTSVDDIAEALALLIEKEAYGIYHAAGKYPKGYITPYEFALKLAEAFNMDRSLIKPISFIEFSKKRIAPRPQHTWIDTTKIENMGMKFTSIEEALNRFKEQISVSH